jgi:hypothetical protein
MNNINKSLSINETYIVEPVDNADIFSACTALYTSAVISCSDNTAMFLDSGVISFNGNLLAQNISGTTFYGDGSHLTGISTQDTYVTGGTYNNGTAIFTNNSGGTFSVTGFSTGSSFTGGTVAGPTVFTNGLTANTFSASTYLGLPSDIHTTAFTFNPATYDITIKESNGVNFTQNLGILASDLTVTGGTYNSSTGVATFTNNTGGTFTVSGFLTGFTDIYTTGGTYNNGTLTLVDTANHHINVNGFLTSLNLQQVTDFGNLTTNKIIVDGGVIVTAQTESNISKFELGTRYSDYDPDYIRQFNVDIYGTSDTYVGANVKISANPEEGVYLINNNTDNGTSVNFGLSSNNVFSYVSDGVTTNSINIFNNLSNFNKLIQIPELQLQNPAAGPVAYGRIFWNDTFNIIDDQNRQVFGADLSASGINFGTQNASVFAQFNLSQLTSTRNYVFQDKDGTLAMLDDIGAIDLNTVTNNGNITQNEISVGDLNLWDVANLNFGGNLSYNDGSFIFKNAIDNSEILQFGKNYITLVNSSNLGTGISNQNVTADQVHFQLPDKSTGDYVLATTDMFGTITLNEVLTAGNSSLLSIDLVDGTGKSNLMDSTGAVSYTHLRAHETG